MAKNTENSYDCDYSYGYTDNMYILQRELRMYSKFMHTLVKLKLMSIRVGQVLISNHGQQVFQKIRDGEI